MSETFWHRSNPDGSIDTFDSAGMLVAHMPGCEVQAHNERIIRERAETTLSSLTGQPRPPLTSA
jgi:hypothetical protein